MRYLHCAHPHPPMLCLHGTLQCYLSTYGTLQSAYKHLHESHCPGQSHPTPAWVWPDSLCDDAPTHCCTCTCGAGTTLGDAVTPGHTSPHRLTPSRRCPPPGLTPGPPARHASPAARPGRSRGGACCRTGSAGTSGLECGRARARPAAQRGTACQCNDLRRSSTVSQAFCPLN